MRSVNFEVEVACPQDKKTNKEGVIARTPLNM